MRFKETWKWPVTYCIIRDNWRRLQRTNEVILRGVLCDCCFVFLAKKGQLNLRNLQRRTFHSQGRQVNASDGNRLRFCHRSSEIMGLIQPSIIDYNQKFLLIKKKKTTSVSFVPQVGGVMCNKQTEPPCVRLKAHKLRYLEHVLPTLIGVHLSANCLGHVQIFFRSGTFL